MQLNTFVNSRNDVDSCAGTACVREVLIEPESLAREGRLSEDDARSLAIYAKSLGLRPVLVWDILMTDDDFTCCKRTLEIVGIENFSAIRVQCIGAAKYLQETFPDQPIHLIAETANCNLKTLLKWCNLLGEQLSRIVLSIQLPAEKLCEYVKKLPVECEILGLGRILLFYSRRNLLAKNFGELSDSWREVVALSDESHDRPFPVIDNKHGTFMYLDKDQFIFHKLEALADGCPSYLRIDLRHLSVFPNVAENIADVAEKVRNSPETLRTSWPRPTIAPFFKNNFTTRQFSKLNSDQRFNRVSTCLAEVVSAERESHTVLRTLQPISLPGAFCFVNPSEEVVPCMLQSVRSLDGGELVEVGADKLVITRWNRKVSIGSLLMLNTEASAK